MIEYVCELEVVGVDLILLECVLVLLVVCIIQVVKVFVIGIGVGVDIDGQVLVLYDMFGVIIGCKFWFVKNFLVEMNFILEVISVYVIVVCE